MAGAVPFLSQPSLRGKEWPNAMAPQRKDLYGLESLQWFSPSMQPSREHMKARQIQKNKREELIEGVRNKLKSSNDSRSRMTLVDKLQQLGVAYHFEDEIQSLLMNDFNPGNGDDLLHTSLSFRLLRQQGFNASSDVFCKFMNKNGRFKQELSKDFCGLLSLHEASYLGVEGEQVLTQAMDFSKHHLQASLLGLDPELAQEVGLTLALPRHRRNGRFEARRSIEHHGHERGQNSDLLELATLDFNMVQSLYHQEVIELIRWWRELRLVEKLPFARDRPLECFLWTVGIFPDPSFSKCRIEVAKAVAILLVLDDIYDSYGSLDELILFTNAIQRWDIAAIGQLPEYMQICYMALYNTTNETSYAVLQEHGWCITSHLKKQWQEICEAFLVESKWFHDGLVPTTEDYLNNGITTAGTYMALVFAFFLIGEEVTRENVGIVSAHPKLFYTSGKILRLWDDLGTAKVEHERGGDVASSIDCFMKEKSCFSDEDARMHVRRLIDDCWKDLNGELVASGTMGGAIVRACLNLARTSQLMYQHGDDEKVPSIDDNIRSLIIEPIHV